MGLSTPLTKAADCGIMVRQRKKEDISQMELISFLLGLLLGFLCEPINYKIPARVEQGLWTLIKLAGSYVSVSVAAPIPGTVNTS